MFVLSAASCGGGGSTSNASVTPQSIGDTGSTATTVTNIDTISPTINFSSSTTSVVAGGTTNLILSATDNVGITSGPDVTCTHDGVVLNNVFTAPDVTENTTVECTAVASDAANNSSSETISFNVLEITRPDTKPKVVLFLMFDDLDYHDLGYNSIDAITPNIDQVASEGKIFKNYYAASAICSPTRVSLLTGQSPIRYGLSRIWPDLPLAIMGQDPGSYYWSLRGLPSSEKTLGNVMKSAGYETLHMGKWHAGTSLPEYLPKGQGFDDFKIMQINPDRGILRFTGPDGLKETETSELWRPTFQANQIIDFIRISDGNAFINWWPTEPHLPLIVPPHFDNTDLNFDLESERGKLLSVMHTFDQEVGRVVEFLKSEGLYDDTLFVITSDNGGVRQALSPQRIITGRKNQLSEGGIRVPFSATWPSQIVPAIDDNSVISSYDMIQTLSSISGQDTLDVRGEDFSESLFNAIDFIRTEGLYFDMRVDSWRRETNDSAANQHAFRKGCYKIADFGSPLNTYKLYDLCTDPSESVDLAQTSPTIFADMVEEIENARQNVGVIFNAETVDSSTPLSDFRLNFHHDDISISGRYRSGSGKIYSRGTGIEINVNNGQINARLTGPVSQTFNPDISSVTLSGPISEGDTFELSVWGYLRAAGTISLLVNGNVVNQVGATPSSVANDLGNSLYAILNEPDQNAVIGSDSLIVDNFVINAKANNRTFGN